MPDWNAIYTIYHVYWAPLSYNLPENFLSWL